MEYYVYQLIDPTTDAPFYVGKGQKKRMYEHVKNIQRDRIPNRNNIYLGRKIKKILKSGLSVKYKKIFITTNEHEAYNREKELIAEIGLENLCNLTSGGESGGNLGRKFSEEHKRKISEFHIGKNNSMFGKVHTEETKQKMSKFRKGKPSPMKGKHHTEEIKRKISESLRGHKQSTEIKQKISLTLKGHVHSEETKRKISNAHKGKRLSEETKRKISNAHKGKRLSEETKRKISMTKRRI